MTPKRSKKGKKLYKATVRKPGIDLRLFERLGVQNSLGLEDRYKYAWSRKQALFLFSKEVSIDSILELRQVDETQVNES